VFRRHSARGVWRAVFAALAVVQVLFVLSACTAPEEPEEPEAPRELSCASPEKVVALLDTHFPDGSCATATTFAETRLTTAFYRKACQQLAPSAGLPGRVEAAVVTHCESATERDGYDGGVVAQIEICCP
jgi:hypothetical protein